ncbi:TPA: site-specific DNA-methyltransferase [Stenotrophomonas maltophilia]|nr:site-specific DNA-methyltransferase [Stenotrophomonas maltophilia]HDX0922080.1 site-specific DNA-methyltransferase [Stenotrophomonas maltophilia]
MLDPIRGSTIHVGNCLDVMRGMAENSVDAIVTDPPYGLSFMGKRWDCDVPSADIWAQCLRVLKPGGHLLAFAGTRTQHRMAVRIEDAGFEIRDMIAWVYGSGFPKSHNGEWGGTALKPAMEPITVARKPLAGTVEANWRQHGTGALNIAACRIPCRDNVDQPRMRDGEQSAQRRYADKGSTTFAVTPGLRGGDPAGRWPANVIHDGSEEVLATFPDAKGQQARVTGAEPTANGFSGAVNFSGMIGRVASGEPRRDAGSAARFFYCAKASKADRDAGLEFFRKSSHGMISETSGQHITRRDDGYQVSPRANNHPTVKPMDLMRYLCRLVTPTGGLVLDPFAGSGSTGRAAIAEGFQFVGIELDPEYAEIAEARCRAVQPGLSFGDVA